jgi:uncharacterized protein (DUF433 family)
VEGETKARRACNRREIRAARAAEGPIGLSPLNGQPCIRGMRLTVRRVVEAAALYPDRNALKREYPELEDEDIAQALDFAARNLDDQILPLEAA